MDEQINIPCLGRPFELGMLYDCRSDQIIPGMTFWNSATLHAKRHVQTMEESVSKIITEDTLETKCATFDIQGSIQLSIIAGLINLKGSGKYLENKKSSNRISRITFHFSCKSCFSNLTMDQLNKKGIEHTDAFENDIATHVVTGIEYGADALFVFEYERNEDEHEKVIQGMLKGIFDKVINSIKGEMEAKFDEEEKSKVDHLKCFVHADIFIDDPPTTLSEAMSVIKRIPSIIRAKPQNGIYGVPKKVYLLPLSKLDSRVSMLLRSISNRTINEISNIIEEVELLALLVEDLQENEVLKMFIGIKEQFKKCRKYISNFLCSFRLELASILPKIRGGKSEEIELLKIIQLIKKSPFEPTTLQAWIDIKQREVQFLKQYARHLQPFPFVIKAGDLEKYTLDESLKQVVGISLAALCARKEEFLDAMDEFSFLEEDSCAREVESLIQNQWIDDEGITQNLQRQLKLFVDFANSNKDKQDVKFVVILNESRERPLGSIVLYSEGKSRLFQPPSSPSVPIMTSNSENSITISWNKPESGVECVTNYEVTYSLINDNNTFDWQLLVTENDSTEVTVNNLKPDRRYSFKVCAVCEVGKTKYSQVSNPCKTQISVKLDRMEPTDEIDSKSFEEINNERSLPDEDILRSNQMEEIVTLKLKENNWCLELGPAYTRHRYRACESPKTRSYVVSFLGNTTAGKSDILQHLQNFEAKPVVLNSEDVRHSTSSNVKLFTSSIQNPNNLNAYFDFEEESESPPSTSSGFWKRLFSQNSSLVEKRRQAVKNYFSKLAYVISNVVVYIGREEFVSAPSINAVKEFAQAAAEGIGKGISKPKLVLIQNMAPLNLSFQPQEITKVFFQTHKEDAKQLYQYFSEIICFRLPHRDMGQKINGKLIDGDIIYEECIDKLKKYISDANDEKHCLRYCQLIVLIKKCVQIMSSGRQEMSIILTLNDILMRDHKDIVSICERIFIRIFQSTWDRSAQSFKKCREICFNALAILLAYEASERGEMNLLHADNLLEKLEEYRPCEAYIIQSDYIFHCILSRCSHTGGMHRMRVCTFARTILGWSPPLSCLPLQSSRGSFQYDSVGNLIEESKLKEKCQKDADSHRQSFMMSSHVVFTKFAEFINKYKGLVKFGNIEKSLCFCGQRYSHRKDIHCENCYNLLQEAKEKSQIGCFVCYTGNRDHLLQPCNHLGFCGKCAATSTKCPHCQMDVESNLKI